MNNPNGTNANSLTENSIGDVKKEVRKRLKYRSESFTLGKLILVEALTMLFALGPGVITWLSAIVYLRNIWYSPYFYSCLIAFPLFIITLFLGVTLIFRLSLPKLKPGVYPIGTSSGFLTWLLNLYLGHSARIAGLQPLFAAFYGLKFLYWRAMGAKVAYGVNSSIFANLSDYPMLTIKKGCTVGAFTFICGHTFVGNKVLVGQVTLEENVYVGHDVAIGPKTFIGAGSWIGSGNRLLQDSIPDNSRIDNFEWAHLNPQKAEIK